MSQRPLPPTFLLVTLLVGLAALGVWFALRAPVGDASIEPAAAAPIAGEVRAAGETLTSDAPRLAPTAATPDVEPQEPARVVLPPRDASDPRLLGRVLDRQGRGVNATVELRTVRAGTLPVEARPTDREGVFDIGVPPRVAFALTIRAPALASVVTESAGIDAGRVVDLGDVVLRDGAAVTGTIRGEDGLALGDVLVELRHDPTTPFRRPVHPLRVVAARSTAGGGLQFSDPIWPGEWRVHVAGRGKVTPGRLVIEEGQRAAVLDVTAAPGSKKATIAGKVTDQYQKPVVGASVLGSGDEGKTWKFSAVTGRDGGFVLTGTERDSPPDTRLRVSAPHCEDTESRRAFKWGSTDADVIVTRGAPVTVRVVDERGEPVEHFAVRIFTRDCADIEELRSRSHGWHPGGIAHAYGVPTGKHLVMVEPDRADLAQAELLEIQATGGPVSCQVTLGPLAHRDLLVRGVDGKPVDNASVELLVPLRGPVRADTPARSVLDLWRNAGDIALRMGHALTNPGGAANLRGHPDSAFFLRVKHFDYAPLVVPITLGWSSTPLEVQLRAGAALDGQLLPAAVATQVDTFGKQVSFALRLVAEGLEGNPRDARLGKDGRFSLRAIPDGDWRLEASWNQLGSRRAQRVTSVLARVPRLANGERRQVTIDAGELLHATVRSRVFVGGAPFHGDLVFQHMSEADDGVPWSIEARPGGGSYTAILPKGRWRPVAVQTKPRTPHSKERELERYPLLCGPAIDLTYVRDLDLSLRTEAVPVKVRLLTKTGAPLVRTAVTVSHDGVPLPHRVTTDGDGNLTTTLAPGTYTTDYGPIEAR